MTDLKTLESETVEVLLVTCTSRLDPTPEGVPEFQVTAVTATSPILPGTWFPGSWTTEWDPISGTIQALTASLGAATADIPLTEGTTVLLWIKWSLASGGELPVLRAVRLKAV